MKLDIIDKSGSWFSYGDIKLGQGKENVKKFLKENKETALEIQEKILAALGTKEDIPTFGNESSDDEKFDEE